VKNKLTKSQTAHDPLGACCLIKNDVLTCNDVFMYESDCRGLEGTFYAGQTCAQVNCRTKPPKIKHAINKLKEALSKISGERDGSVAKEHILPAGKWVSLKADNSDNDKGLLCSYNEDGSYDIKYWYGDTENVVNFNLEADGDAIGEDIRAISILIDEESDNEE